MEIMKILFTLYALIYRVLGSPAAKPDDDDAGIPPMISFKDGTVGVNFLGFKASAGLGGLLTGDASHGGLHAEAETPFGQKAGAGLGGMVDGNGRSLGGLYAGATAGGGVGASAGLDGVADSDGSAGRSYAGASAGGAGKTVVKERLAGPVGGGSVNIQKISPPPISSEVVQDKIVASSKSQVSIQIAKEEAAAPPPPPPEIKRTYVERTLIPNYVEKTIQVPSYVEKTIRVPTVVEKTIKVPAPPTIVEKEVEVPQPVKTVTKTKHVVVQGEEGPEVPPTIVKTKTKFHRRPWLQYRKRLNINSGETPYYGGVIAADAVGTNTASDSHGSFGAFGDFGTTTYYKPPPATYTTTVRKQFNGNLVRDIFNIPIATLGAVSDLVGNIAGGGSVSVSKSYGATY